VIDLRRDFGGDPWAMLAGIGPILGEGELGASASPAGRVPWSYRGGRSLEGDHARVAVAHPTFTARANAP